MVYLISLLYFNGDFMKRFIKILALICAVLILFTACGAGVHTQSIKADEIKYQYSDYAGDSLHQADGKAYKSIAKSGLIELLYDENTMTVAIKDTGSGNIWTSLATAESADKKKSLSAVEVELSKGDENVYVLNSQDNSVNFGNAVATEHDNGISIKYALSLDAETGKKDIEELEKETIRVDLTVNYTLKDGSFYTNVSMNTVTLPEGVYLEKIRVLKDFGSFEKSGAEDYIFVPDGSGALIMTGVEEKDFEPLSLSVYGDDPAINTDYHNFSCLVGAFGVKRSSGAFLCIIESGESIAEIEAERNSDSTLNRVGAVFNITDTCIENGKSNIKKILGNQFKNEITLCYRFLSGRSATYGGMATACRENLIRNGVLSTSSITVNSQYLPLIVELCGEMDGTTLSTFSQAQSLLTLLKAKGVNNVYLDYSYLYGNDSSLEGFGNFDKALGNSKDYKALYSYINSQNFSLFLGTDLLTFNNGANNAIKIDGGKAKLQASTSNALSLLKMSELENIVEDILKSSAQMEFDGYALNGVGNCLYSDYSNDFYSRVTAKKEISAQLPVLATSKMIMVDGGNIYSVKNADMVNNIPLSPIAKSENKAYVGIPFVQMMIHGMTEYSANINYQDNPKLAFLNAVEYGALPQATWYCTHYTEAMDSKCYYDSNINEMVEFYTKANDILGEIRAERMTAHYLVQENVYCTEYDNSTKVYVNYGDKAVTINGITIPAMDCVKI